MKFLQQGMALILCLCLLLTGTRGAFAQTDTPSAQQPPQAAIQSPEQLQQLVAPIALYPDSLIAQILAAATYPEQVVDAKTWLDQHPNLTGDSLAKEIDQQPWDPSVKALTQFPAVLNNMNQNLAWTSELGDVYVNQQQDVTQAIQVMRQRAKQAGNLKTTPEEKVSDKGPTIVIESASPDVIYVPQYDPWLVYGAPLAVFPGWYPYPGLYLAGPGLGFFVGTGFGLFGGFGWGWRNWGFDWGHGGRIIHNHNTFISHSRTIINRNNFNRNDFNRNNFNRGAGSRGQGFDRGQGFHAAPNVSHAPTGTHSGAFGGFNHGGIARGNASRGQSSFGGGFHGGGGGFHGGGGGGMRGGGGGRR